MPAYLQHADVLVVPHVVTPFTDSLDPIKLYEYHAAGRPVVTTPVAGFRDAADTLVTVADRAVFVAAIVDAMASRQEPLVPVPNSQGPYRRCGLERSRSTDGRGAGPTALAGGAH